MNKKKIIALGLTVLMSIGLITGCGNEKKKAQGESKKLSLTIYSGLMEDHANAVAKQFQEDTGIETHLLRLSGGEILARLKAEKENPKASVWFAGPADGFIQAKKLGLLEKYVSQNSDKIPDQFKDKDGYWTGIYKGYFGFFVNTKLLQERGAEMPKSWQDLLKPEFKGQVVVANPGSSSTAYTCLSTVVQLMGKEKAMEYFKKLDGQIKQYPKSGLAPVQMTAMGEAMVGLGFLHDGIKFQEQGYKDLDLVAPSEGTGYEIGAVAMVKDAPDKEAAQKFIDWCLTAKAQELGQKYKAYQFLTNSDAHNPKQVEKLKDAKLINYDFEFSGKNKSGLVEEWHKTTGK